MSNSPIVRCIHEALATKVLILVEKQERLETGTYRWLRAPRFIERFGSCLCSYSIQKRTVPYARKERREVLTPNGDSYPRVNRHLYPIHGQSFREVTLNIGWQEHSRLAPY